MTASKKAGPGGSAPEPADFAEFCRIFVGTINVGDIAFPIDMEALADFVASRNWPQETLETLTHTRAQAVAAYVANDMEALLARVQELHRLVHSLRAQELAHSSAKAQSRRRKGKPAADPHDMSRNDRLKAFHARIVNDGHRDATSQTAHEFELGTRQVRNILTR